MKQKKAAKLITLLTIICLTMLVAACGSAPATPTQNNIATAPVPTTAVSETDEAASTPAGELGKRDKAVKEVTEAG
jgi:hypothetical protein